MPVDVSFAFRGRKLNIAYGEAVKLRDELAAAIEHRRRQACEPIVAKVRAVITAER